MKYLENLLEIINLSNWAAQIIVVLLMAIIINKIFLKILHNLQGNSRKTKNIWDDALIKAIQKPLSFLIFASAIAFSFKIANQHFIMTTIKIAPKMLNIGVICSIAWFFIGFIKEAKRSINQKKLPAHEKIDRATIDVISNIATILVLAVTGLTILQALGVHIGGILALGGVGGIAVGFASKDLLSNFFGGLMIHLDRPFQVDDWIRSPDKEIEGTVTKIGWRQTHITTFDYRPLYVPNSVFATIVVENPSRMSHRRIKEVIGVRYDDINKVEKITAEIKETLLKSDIIDKEQTIYVNLDSFGASSVDMILCCATIATDLVDFRKAKQDILLKAAEIIAKNKAEIAFPTSVVYLNNVEK